MMTYLAPDGYIIKSKDSPTTYTCACEDMHDGTYESFETTFASTAIGIQQIKIVRTVTNNMMTITITQSTNQELTEYINTIQNQ